MASVGNFARSAALPAQRSWVRREPDAFLTSSTLTYVRTSSAAWSVCWAAYRLSSRTHSLAYLVRVRRTWLGLGVPARAEGQPREWQRLASSAWLAVPGSGLLLRPGGSGRLLARGGRPGVGAGVGAHLGVIAV